MATPSRRILDVCTAILIAALNCNAPLVGAFSALSGASNDASHIIQRTPFGLFATVVPPSEGMIAEDQEDQNSPLSEIENGEPMTLPGAFPELAGALERMRLSSPTPIQEASAERALQGENLLLVAPTGSGKTLAYLLPAISRALETDDGVVMVVAPTRELAVQLQRDSVELLRNLQLSVAEEGEDVGVSDTGVRLCIRGLDPPSLEDPNITILIGTPPELLDALKYDGHNFLQSLTAVVLDEVDVLLPPEPKKLRTALDLPKSGRTPRQERVKMEQARKLKAAQRRGVPMDKETNRILTDTERVLGMIAAAVSENGPPQILSGSATASRKTLDRLNQALRAAIRGTPVPPFNVMLCRPKEDPSAESSSEEQHTIRAVSVPTEVDHRYVLLDKEVASDPESVIQAVASATSILKPKYSLLFLCGEFGKSVAAEKAPPKREIRGATSVARRNAKRKAAGLFAKMEKKAKQKKGKVSSGLSALKTCKLLSEHKIEAQPLHVAMGLEHNVAEEDIGDEVPPFLVTFEGSARGLHLENVDAVFVVGRPSSAAAYLHLAGRVGRAYIADDGKVEIRPGTVVSICTKGSASELDKWTKQIGGLELTELESP